MTTLSRRTLLQTAGAVSLASVLAACADTGADGRAVSSSGGDADYDAVISSGPVAADDVVAASTWASAIKEAGVFKIGGTKTAPVFSSEDATTGRVSGFDAALGQILARYIIGGDDARALLAITQVTPDTRETVLENGSVQAVIATYSITPERDKKIDFAGPHEHRLARGVVGAGEIDLLVAPWPWTPRSCSSTSPPPPSTPATRSGC